MLLRLCEIALKLTLCLPFKGKYIPIRVFLFPLHFLFLPHYVFIKHYSRMKCLLESLGVVFIKLGQSLSLKSFLFEKQFLEVLSHLQDSVKSSCTVDINKHLCNNSIVANKGFFVEEKPISTASVAHVYRGKVFHNGLKQTIAIKVVKNGVQKQIERDFAILLPIVKLASRFLSPAFQIIEVTRDIHAGLLKEINLNNEMQNLMVIKRNIIFDDAVKIPQVFLEYSNKTTLVMEFIDGISIRKLIHGECTGVNRKTVARNIVETYLNQVYRDGIFHADMHSGNIFAKSDGAIALLDFGIVSSIEKKDRRAVATIIYAFLHNKHELALKVQLEAGYITHEVFFNQEYRNAMQKLMHIFQKNFKMSLFSKDLFLIMNRFNVFVPKHLLLLNKTIMYVEDITTQLDSTFNPFTIMLPWIKKWYYKERVLMFFEKILQN